jgi:serine/threonine protein kinase
MGYAAPEYVQTGRLTSKSDVWSYGVFLYELITGRRPLDRNRPKREQKLLEWVKPFLSDMKKFHLILDPRLEGKYPLKSAQKLAIVANRCLVRHPKNRPKMSEVLEMVNQIAEASTETGSPPLPLKSLAQVETSVDTEPKNNKRNVDLRTGESGWFVRMWTPKLLRTS